MVVKRSWGRLSQPSHVFVRFALGGYCTVTETLAVCDVVPSVPVTATTYVPGSVPFPPPPPPELLPPQPTAARIKATVMRVSATDNLRRFAGIPNSRTPANTAPLPPSHKGALLGLNPAVVVMLTVTVPLLVVPLSTRGPPLTVHPTLEVGDAHVKVMVPLYPLRASIVIVDDPEPPGAAIPTT